LTVDWIGARSMKRLGTGCPRYLRWAGSIASAFVVAVFVLAGGAVTYAEEGGAGHYVPGSSATLIDLPPSKPGWVIEPIYLHYNGDASVRIPIAGEIVGNLEATSNAFLIGAFYTFDQMLLGAHYTVGGFVPLVRISVEGSVTLGGTTVRRKDTETGLGDITLIPAMLAWKSGAWQYNAFLPIYAPTGDYEEGRLANSGLNYWTFDPTFGISYNNEKSGFNAAVNAGVTINTENPDTDYRSGSMFHLEASAQQLLPLGPGFFGVGTEVFYLEQVTGDSGSGARLGDFQGRTVGIGPVLTYILPRGDATLVGEFRWLPEIDTKRRLKGDYFWLKLACQF
jgi:hypothetical protein